VKGSILSGNRTHQATSQSQALLRPSNVFLARGAASLRAPSAGRLESFFVSLSATVHGTGLLLCLLL
ncbi:MAG: hypothetical protein ACK53L_31990, partial [Pirellulaceae bacterium]